MHLSRTLLSIVALVLVATASVAVADVVLEARTLEPDAKVKGGPPSLEITVIGAPMLEASSYSLKQADRGMSAIAATRVIPFIEGPDPIAVVVVIEADGNYLAGEMIEGVTAALTSVGAGGPAGSLGSVITYTDAATVVASAKPLTELGGVTLTPGPAGPKAARGLVPALKAAVAELDKLSPKRKVILIMGDLVDGAGMSTASGPVREIGRQLSERKVTVFAIINQISTNATAFGQPVAPMILDPETKEMVPNTEAVATETRAWRQTLTAAVDDAKFLTSDRATVIVSRTGFASAAESIIGELADRFYVRFPGVDPKTKAALAWDGKTHPLVLRVEGADMGTVEAELSPKWSRGGGGSRWWLFVVIPVGLIGAGFIAMKAMGGKKSAASAAPGPAAPGTPGGAAVPGAPAVFGVPATAPGAAPGGGAGKPMKTQFINLAGDDVFPVVAWMVFLNGPQRFKSHKLAAGVTKIGTGKESDIAIDDGYMSTNHAVIVMSPDGFTLQDSSRNGTVVNGQRISKHELNDGDVVVFGQTQMKFKATI